MSFRSASSARLSEPRHKCPQHRFAKRLSPTAGKFQVLLVALAACAAAPSAWAADPVLRVSAPGQSLALTAQELAALPHTEISAFNPHEKTATAK